MLPENVMKYIYNFLTIENRYANQIFHNREKSLFRSL